MTDTDELRRMLDKRGVFWIDVPLVNTKRTCWKISEEQDGYCYFDEDAFIATVTELTVTGITPAQAIAATVGRGTCHATSNPPVPKYWTGCSNCGSVWDFFYNMCGYMGPPNYCPNCGRRVVDE